MSANYNTHIHTYIYIYIYTLSHPGAQKSELRSASELQASIDRKITKLYENPEKPPNPTEMFSIFFGIKRLGPCSTHTISHPKLSEKFFE